MAGGELILGYRMIDTPPFVPDSPGWSLVPCVVCERLTWVDPGGQAMLETGEVDGVECEHCNRGEQPPQAWDQWRKRGTPWARGE